MNKREFLKTSLLGMGAIAITSKLGALEYYPTRSDRKWAVLYSTWCGTARDAGVWISEGMEGIANVFDVRENPDLLGYESIVVGGAIRGGRVSGELQEYLERNRGYLRNRIRGLFVVCGNRMQPPTPGTTTDLIDNHLAKICGVSNVPSRVFLGRVTYGLLDEESRNLLKGFNMPEYDNLKRSDCMAFGKEVLQTVK
jgi:menaquinone-dependent protoporphyrinogen IX oxidase